jgi:hypothetical protein
MVSVFGLVDRIDGIMTCRCRPLLSGAPPHLALVVGSAPALLLAFGGRRRKQCISSAKRNYPRQT